MTFTHFWFICCFFSFGCIRSSSTFPSFYLCRMIVWKLERNASSTSSTNFFSQYETHTQQAILWFCPVWLVIGVFSSSSNFPFRLWTRMFSTLSSCPNKKVDTFEIPVEYMVLYILFLQKCRRAPRIPFPYTSISAI